MATNEEVDKLVIQCKANDVDVKVDALNKLQAFFSDGIEPTDIDGFTSVLKSCLRTANQHLTAASLATIPPFIRLIIPSTTSGPRSPSSSPATNANVQHLRQALVAFLPAGGVVDRLGEQREKARESAREALVVLASAAFVSGPSTSASKMKDVAKGHEPPLMLVEKYIKELGLGSKVFRVREQAILALVDIRRNHPSFPIRPYLPQLVECLEDTDGTVRDCARASVITLFTGAQVTDAARTDLKNEMTKKGVRKTIVNDVLSKLLGSVSGPASGSETPTGGDDGSASSSRLMSSQKPAPVRSATAPVLGRSVSAASVAVSNTSEEVVPTQPVEIVEVFIASSRDLENEFAQMAPCFEGKETEHNWLDREKSVIRIRGMLRGDAHNRYPDVFFQGLKGGMLEKTLKALQSLRTTVSCQACALYSELAEGMGTAFDPLIETVLTHLLKIGGFTKKLIAQQSQASVTAILTYTSATPRLVLPLLWSYLQEKTVQVRAYVLSHLKTILEVHGKRPAGKAAIEAAGGLEVLDKSLKKGLADPNPGVRDQSRTLYWIFEETWPGYAVPIMASLNDVAKKQLEKFNPRPGAAATTAVAATPAPKKSSVAAAIAASRAKAKIIATAPPTLRHAATSAASAQSRNGLPGSTRREGSPVSPRRVTSPGAAPRVGSPSSPAGGSGLASPPASRSASPPARPSHFRASTTSSTSPKGKTAPPMNVPSARTRAYSPSPPASPTPASVSAGNRRTSPLATRTSLAAGKRPSLSASAPLARGSPSAANGNGRAQRNSRLSTSSLSDAPEDEFISAMRIPLPPGSDDGEDFNESLNLMSFSSAWENMEGASSALTLPAPGVPDSVIHDSYRAQAQQAESAAAQLLELVNDDMGELEAPPPMRPFASPNMPMVPLVPVPSDAPTQKVVIPATPKNRAGVLAKALNDFKDSPRPTESPTLAKLLFERNDKTGDWWRLRRRFLHEGPIAGSNEGTDKDNIRPLITKVEAGTADVDTLKSLIWISSQHPSCSPPPSPGIGSSRENGMLTPTTPSPMGAFRRPASDTSIWEEGRAFDALLLGLSRFLDRSKPDDILDYGLMLLYEMVLNQSTYLTGQEATIFSFLLEVRYSRKLNVFEATNAIRDTMIEKSDPLLGLATVHRTIEDFLKKAIPDEGLADARISTYCFALVAMAKFILLLPAEVLEDELPRMKGTIMTALSNPTTAVVREAAYVVIIASQMKLRDETQLFALLSGLTETQKHLLTYEFERIKARGPAREENDAGLQKLAGKIRHLDALPSPAAT